MTGTASGPPSGGLMASILRLLATLSAIGRNRLSLLAVELEEERNRVLAVLAWGAVAILMGTVASVFLAGFITVLFWDTHPLLVLGLLTLAFGAVCVWAVSRVRAIAGSPEGMLAATLAELQADQDALSAAARGAVAPEQKG